MNPPFAHMCTVVIGRSVTLAPTASPPRPNFLLIRWSRQSKSYQEQVQLDTAQLGSMASFSLVSARFRSAYEHFLPNGRRLSRNRSAREHALAFALGIMTLQRTPRASFIITFDKSRDATNNKGVLRDSPVAQ